MADLPNNASDQSSPARRSSGLFANLTSPLSQWLRSRRLIPNASEVGRDDAMVIDKATGPLLNLPRAVKKDDSLSTVSTQPTGSQSQSSQEYENSWGDLIKISAEDLERGAADAERAALAASMAQLPFVSRETSDSSLGKRSRHDAAAEFPRKKRAYQNSKIEDDNPFIIPRHISVASSSTVPATIIAQPPEALIDAIKTLAWGVQWEIARLVTAGLITYADVAAHLPKLTGLNESAASKVVQLLRPIIVGNAAGPVNHRPGGKSDPKAPWAELDREETALNEDLLVRLGVSPQEKYRNYYGGQVHFSATLGEKTKGKSHSNAAGGPFDIILQKPELGPSNRLARRFGSRRFIRIRVPKPILGGNKFVSEKASIDFFRVPFVLHSRVFKAFGAKDGNVFLVEVTDYEICKPPPGSPAPSFAEFLDFHNPRALNSQQPLAKWAARFALGLSNSVPGVLLLAKNIHYISDIVAFHGEGKPPPEKIMTDGCGWINAYGLRMLQVILRWNKLPTAVQVRIGGAKGLLLLHPDGKYIEGDHETHVWIRPSQTKIQYDESQPPDPARLIIDVLQPARLKYPSRISAETIINIAHNQRGTPKVRHGTILKLMHDGLVEAINGLVNWSETTPQTQQNEANHPMPLLWHEVSKAGNVMAMRMARDFSGSARARGVASRWDEIEEEKEEEVSPTRLFNDILPTSSPATAEETAMSLLSAGFDPRRSKFLNDKIKFIVRKVANRYTQNFRITVPGSAEAFCVPDPKGVLEPGEVYLRTSQPVKNQYGVDVDVLQGDVLVTRHPTKTPTDVQRVKAVSKPELYEYTDVIIFSTKGDRSLASLLAGGDYDGDTVTIIWEPGLVESFVNADLKFSLPPEGLDSNFEIGTNETVAEFQYRTASMLARDVIRELQTVLLGALRDVSIVGSYSIFHDNAVYTKGYDHIETIRLAYMFCACLDGGKSGLRVKNSVFRADKKKWDVRGPQWKETEESSSDQKSLQRGKGLGAFIMDDLKFHGEVVSNKLIKNWEEKCQPLETPDEDLIRPWIEAKTRATELQAVFPQLNTGLQAISEHVSQVRKQYADAWSSQSPSNACLPKSHTKLPNFGDKIIADITLELSKGPQGLRLFTDSQCEELKASYAYWLDSQRTPFGSFAFRITLRELLRIKAASVGGISVTPEFYRCFDIQSGVKSLGKHAGR